MGFPAFAENPIYIFLPPHTPPFDRGVCLFLRIYAVQRIHTPFIRPFSIDGVSVIWGAPHTAQKDDIRQANFVICPYGHIFTLFQAALFHQKSCRASLGNPYIHVIQKLSQNLFTIPNRRDHHRGRRLRNRRARDLRPDCPYRLDSYPTPYRWISTLPRKTYPLPSRYTSFLARTA